MADIKTILRELSVIYGYLISKYNLKAEPIHVNRFIEIISKYCKNLNKAELQKITDLQNFEQFQNTLKNGIALGKEIAHKLVAVGDISWVGGAVNSKYPFDIMVGKVGISLKEDSYILKNPSFANYLNALTSPKIPYKNIHVFREYAPKEFSAWFEYTIIKLKEYTENFVEDEIVFNYDNRYYIIKLNNALKFTDHMKVCIINLDQLHNEMDLNQLLGGKIFEHTFSKWIKQFLEKDENYVSFKRECSQAAGTNLKSFVEANLKIDSSAILELLQIYDDPYYYGKSDGEVHLYLVPSNKDLSVGLQEVEIKVPGSQLNVYFTFQINLKKSAESITFRVECRYSHGQFKGIPEAKLYYTDSINHLNNLYTLIK